MRVDMLVSAVATVLVNYVIADTKTKPFKTGTAGDSRWYEQNSWQNSQADVIQQPAGGRPRQQHDWNAASTQQHWPAEGSGAGSNVDPDLDSSWPANGGRQVDEDSLDGSGAGGLGVDDEDAPVIGTVDSDDHAGSGNHPMFVDPIAPTVKPARLPTHTTARAPVREHEFIEETGPIDPPTHSVDQWWTEQERTAPGFVEPHPQPMATTAPTMTTISTTTTSTSTTTTTARTPPPTTSTVAPVWTWPAPTTTTMSAATPSARPDVQVLETTDTGIYDVPPTPNGDSSLQKRFAELFLKPGILAAVIGGAVVGLLCAILLVFFIVYRMRKKDEGSYALDEPKSPSQYGYAYQKAPTKEFYA